MNREAIRRRLSTMQISWEGTPDGLAPVLADDDASLLDPSDESALAALIEALPEVALFVPAHVLLTRLSGVRYTAFPDWNGLRVVLRADGTAEIDPAQRTELAQRWRRWFAQHPRPDHLPA